ncbi:PAP2-domain-containing protein [Sistotremastrum niveocremeum HHB9708]|uniref:PAP2-domain-containing protein n=1 Tax=Sistotremastrum niveocremeum HHB9708 TaxID=1314777 RepID=A0A164XCW6_9AGAM|nr:PAP2-domain-containing protein [Sistotremastrum niveocremeum HHB9708]
MSVWLQILNRTSRIVTALTALFFLYTRSLGVAYFIAGAVACSIFVKSVKKVIRQPRPPGLSKKVSYGMPSTHSATIMFYATYIVLASALLPIHQSLPQSPLTRVVPPVVAVPWASSIALSRIRLGHHTPAQVFVGSVLGCAFAASWFSLEKTVTEYVIAVVP